MTENTSESPNNMMTYVLGGALVVVLVVGGFLLRPKSPATQSGTPTGQTETPQATAMPLAPVKGLACDKQYYNPVIGFEKYYISVEGVDTEGASEVTCITKITQENKVIATEETSVPLSENATRGGLTFKCSTSALELKPTIPTKVDVELADDRGAKATCSALFALPKP